MQRRRPQNRSEPARALWFDALAAAKAQQNSAAQRAGTQEVAADVREGRHKGGEDEAMRSGTRVDGRSERWYNQRGWALEDGVIDKNEFAEFFDCLSDKKNGVKFSRTSDGKYLFAVGHELGVNNVVIVSNGNHADPSIDRVYRIDLDNETDIEIVRDFIYEREARDSARAGDYVQQGFGTELVNTYMRSDISTPGQLRSEGSPNEGSRSEKDYRHNRFEPDGTGDFGETKHAVTENGIKKAPDTGASSFDGDDLRESRRSDAGQKEEVDSIKRQIREHKDEINKMDVVATIQSDGRRGKNKSQLKQVVSNEFRRFGWQVDRENFGIILLDDRRISDALEYVNNDAEYAAIFAVPQVLKRGIVIGEHSNHKGRGFKTITFAAPVSINGMRGNVAVTVKKTGTYKYKMHRILAPDGTTFEFSEKSDAEPTTGVGKLSDENGMTPIGPASKENLSQNRMVVKNQDLRESRRSPLPAREAAPALQKAKEAIAARPVTREDGLKTTEPAEVITKIACGLHGNKHWGLKDPTRNADAFAGGSENVRSVLADLIERPFNEAGGIYARALKARGLAFLKAMGDLGITTIEESAA